MKRNQEQSTEYLNEKWGLGITSNELSVLGKWNAGPHFERARYNEKQYTPEELDRWAKEQLASHENDAA